MSEPDLTTLVVLFGVLVVAAVANMFLWWEGYIFKFTWLLRASTIGVLVVWGAWAVAAMAADALQVSTEALRPYVGYAALSVQAGGAVLDFVAWLRGDWREPPPSFGGGA